MGASFAEALGSIGFSVGSGNGNTDSGPEGEEFPGEVDYGLASAEDIPTRVKTPDKPERKRTPPRSSAKLELRLAAIKEGLEDELNDAGMAAGQMGFATAGYVVMDGSQAFTDAIVELARNRPRLLKTLEKASQGAKGTKMAKYLLAIVMAVMVDLEMRSPEEFGMSYLGVKKAYDATHPDGPATNNGFSVSYGTPPPQFG